MEPMREELKVMPDEIDFMDVEIGRDREDSVEVS